MALDDSTIKRLLTIKTEKDALIEAREKGKLRRANNNPVHVPYLDRVRRKKQEKAHYKARQALKQGIILRDKCSKCGSSSDLHMHHKDYDKPLEITWLCRYHHHKHHNQVRSQELVRLLAASLAAQAVHHHEG